jgi:hypothetical protein
MAVYSGSLKASHCTISTFTHSHISLSSIYRVPRAASSEPSVLLNVATHSDGTITYSFGAEADVPPVVASIPLATPNVHQEAPEATTSAASGETNGPTTTTTTTTTVATVSTAEQLDKLLHLTPELSNGHSLPANGSSENGNGSSNGNGAGKVHHIEDIAEDVGTSTEDESISVAKKLSKAAAVNRKQAAAAAAANKAPKPSSSSSSSSTNGATSDVHHKGPLTPQTVDYRDAPAVTVDRLYARLCDSGKLDDALLVVKECIRAGRGDVLKL